MILFPKIRGEESVKEEILKDIKSNLTLKYTGSLEGAIQWLKDNPNKANFIIDKGNIVDLKTNNAY